MSIKREKKNKREREREREREEKREKERKKEGNHAAVGHTFIRLQKDKKRDPKMHCEYELQER